MIQLGPLSINSVGYLTKRAYTERSTDGEAERRETLHATSDYVPPAFGTSHGTRSELVLREVTRESQGGHEKIDLVYRRPDSAINAHPPVGTETKSCETEIHDVPLSLCYSLTAATIADLREKGHDPLLLPRAVYTLERTLSSWTWDESSILGTVGRLGAPVGVVSATADRWLHTRLAVRQTGSVYVRTDQHLHCGPPSIVGTWSAAVYGAATTMV